MTESQSLRVLLVDDEDSFRLSIEMGLKMTSTFVIESCASGEEAVDLLKRETFDVILLDNRMGEMSGMDVLEWMHKQKISTPVILVTAAGSESTAIEALQLGVYDYIRKDHLDIERLSLAIKSVYERYQYRKQIIENDAKERLLLEKQHELDSLRTFHDTVNSIGQLVEKSLGDLSSALKRHENALLATVKEGKEQESKDIFTELKQGLEVIASGVSSMRSLSTMVTKKLDEIHIVPQHNKH
ncbi:MAG TPA: response regulator [Bacteroidota bacterium]|nr:response regulator [Bacteroidota bacterium]